MKIIDKYIILLPLLSCVVFVVLGLYILAASTYSTLSTGLTMLFVFPGLFGLLVMMSDIISDNISIR